jgi:hypothetical protein
MATHVKVIAALYLVFGALFVIAALFSSVTFGVFASLAGSSPEEGAPLGMAILGLTGVALALVLIVIGAPSIVCGWGLLKRRPWGRILGIVLAAIAVIHFPLGTVFGVYVLWVLFQKRTEALFDTPMSGAVDPR